MNLAYLKNELYYQWRRTLTAIIGLAIGIALLIILNSLSVAYRQAAQTPLKEIGADIVVQRPGNVPERLEGVVFPIRLGDTISIANQSFPVVGLVDASRVAKIAVVNAFLPLREAQALAVSSPLVQSVSPFGPSDVNLLFLKADRDRITALASAIPGIVEKATIGTPDSFLKLLGSIFALSDKFALAASLIAILVAVLIVFKTMAGNIAERIREIGVLKAVGWTDRNVAGQLFSESVVQCFIGGLLGLGIALVVALGLRFIQVDIPIPWDMNPRPHFLPGGGEQLFKTVRLPVRVPWLLAVFALLLSVAIGGLTGMLLARSISRIQPSEVLRHD
jgi:putative ABC transport system permease protein